MEIATICNALGCCLKTCCLRRLHLTRSFSFVLHVQSLAALGRHPSIFAAARTSSSLHTGLHTVGLGQDSKDAAASCSSSFGFQHQFFPVGDIADASEKTSSNPILTCDLCNTTFKGRLNKYSLQRHVRVKHWKHLNLHPCPNCDASFNRKDSLTKHIATRHGKECFTNSSTSQDLSPLLWSSPAIAGACANPGLLSAAPQLLFNATEESTTAVEPKAPQ